MIQLERCPDCGIFPDPAFAPIEPNGDIDLVYRCRECGLRGKKGSTSETAANFWNRMVLGKSLKNKQPDGFKKVRTPYTRIPNKVDAPLPSPPLGRDQLGVLNSIRKFGSWRDIPNCVWVWGNRFDTRRILKSLVARGKVAIKDVKNTKVYLPIAGDE